jgi:hypothetical protein
MMKLIRTYLRSGITPETEFGEARRISLMHGLNIILAMVTFPHTFSFYLLGMPVPALGTALIAPYYLSLPLVTARIGFAASRVMFFIMMSASVFLYSNYLGEGSATHLNFYGLAAVPFLITTPREKPLVAFAVGLPIACFVTLKVTNFALLGGSVLSPQVQGYLQMAMIPTSFIALLATITHFAVVTQRVQNLLDGRNEEMSLVLKNVEQGLVTVDLEGRLSDEHSAALDHWFGSAESGATL